MKKEKETVGGLNYYAIAFIDVAMAIVITFHSGITSTVCPTLRHYYTVVALPSPYYPTPVHTAPAVLPCRLGMGRRARSWGQCIQH